MDINSLGIIALCIITIVVVLYFKNYIISMLKSRGINMGTLDNTDDIVALLQGVINEDKMVSDKNKAVVNTVAGIVYEAKCFAQDMYAAEGYSESECIAKTSQLIIDLYRQNGIIITSNQEKVITRVVKLIINNVK